MPDKQDSGYFGVRAGEERRMAETTADPRASAAHAELAARYQKLSLEPDFVLPAIINETEIIMAGLGSETDHDA